MKRQKFRVTQDTHAFHYDFFGRPWCQRMNWRGAQQQFLLVKACRELTCKSCLKQWGGK